MPPETPQEALNRAFREIYGDLLRDMLYGPDVGVGVPRGPATEQDVLTNKIINNSFYGMFGGSEKDIHQMETVEMSLP